MTNSQFFVLVREGDVAVYGLHEFGKEIGVRSPRPNPLADADLVVVAGSVIPWKQHCRLMRGSPA